MRPITLAPARLHGVVTLAVAALLVCMSFVAAPAAFAAAAAPVVDDQFERSVASGWGATPAGQQWTTSSPCWANGASGTRSFRTMADFSSFTGNDTRSAEWNGAAIVGSDLMLRADVVASPRATLAGLPTDAATAVGVKAGSTRLGPFSEPRR